MDELDLYTVTVFQTQKQEDASGQQLFNNNVTLVKEYQNMISARVIGAKILELEHSNLAGPLVKFKTIVDFKDVMAPDTCLGLLFTPQNDYIVKT